MTTSTIETRLLALQMARHLDTKDCTPFFTDEIEAVAQIKLRGVARSTNSYIFTNRLN